MSNALPRRSFLHLAMATGTTAVLPPWLGALDAATATLSAGGSRKRVVILGAGLAGLSAAYELNTAGHDVTVLEARMWPGWMQGALESGHRAAGIIDATPQ